MMQALYGLGTHTFSGQSNASQALCAQAASQAAVSVVLAQGGTAEEAAVVLEAGDVDDAASKFNI